VADVADVTSIELEVISAGGSKMQAGSLVPWTSEEDTEVPWYKCDLPTTTDQQIHSNDATAMPYKGHIKSASSHCSNPSI